jgi:hypothetical protein
MWRRHTPDNAACGQLGISLNALWRRALSHDYRRREGQVPVPGPAPWERESVERPDGPRAGALIDVAPVDRSRKNHANESPSVSVKSANRGLGENVIQL